MPQSLPVEKTALGIYNLLCEEIIGKTGQITFDMAGVNVVIDTTDIVGNCLQSWLKEWLQSKGIYVGVPENTQEFPDFFIARNNKFDHMLEVKSFNYKATPAFDIANYESYVKSVSEKPFRLNADYLIIGYTMDNEGIITIRDMWLKKIWEIAGTSNRFALNTQVKKNVIYNIRPNSRFKYGQQGPFSNKEQFLNAIYETQKAYRGQEAADNWKSKLIEEYQKYYNNLLTF